MSNNTNSINNNNGAELTFVVATNLKDARSSANKRRVRSAAALKSWDTRLAGIRKRSDWTQSDGSHVKRSTASGTKKRRKSATILIKATEQAKTKLDSSQQPDSPNTHAHPEAPIPTKADSSPTKTFKLTGPGIKRLHSDEIPGRAAVHLKADHAPLPPGEVKVPYPTPELTPTAPTGPCRCSLCRAQSQDRDIAERAKQPLHKPNYFLINDNDPARSSSGTSDTTHHALVSFRIPGRFAAGKLDPFNCSPVEHKPWFDHILHHMLTVFAPRGWPALKITRAEGLDWEWFMTQHALSEPALFYVRLLFATGDLVRMNTISPGITYWLRAQAIQAINDALADPTRATSDAIILAVGRIALHEGLYGDKQAAHSIHRPAQQRMIAMRGGMHCLPFPPLIKRLMRWADRVMSMQGGTQRMIPDEEEVFTVKASVEVLEEWVPAEGQALRRKVTIPNNAD